MALKFVRAEFIGYQDMFDGSPIPLFNIVGDHPRNGSTVFQETLRKLGIDVPAIPSFEEWRTGGRL